MTDIDFDRAPSKEIQKTDEAAGRGLPADPKYIDKAIREFDGVETIQLPPIPRRVDLQRKTPSIEKLLGRADLLIQHGDRRNAAHLVRQALAINSSHPAAMKMMIRTLDNTEFARLEKGKLFQAIVKCEPSFENFLNLAKFHYDNQEIPPAQLAVERAFCFPTENKDNLLEANKLIGNIALQAGDLETAEEFYNKAFAINSESAALLVNMGTLEIQRSNWERAKERFAAARASSSGHDLENLVKSLVGLYLVAREKGIKDDGRLLQEALKINPFNRTAVHLFAHWSHQSDRHLEGIKVLETYLDQNEFDEDMSIMAAQFYCVRGDFEGALLESEKTALWNPKNKELVEMMNQIRELA